MRRNTIREASNVDNSVIVQECKRETAMAGERREIWLAFEVWQQALKGRVGVRADGGARRDGGSECVIWPNMTVSISSSSNMAVESGRQ